MAKLTRRKMLWTSSASVAALGGVAALLAGVNRQTTHAAAPETSTSNSAVQLPTSSASGPMVAYVSDVTKGEVRLMVGEKEFVVQDAALVSHMVNSAH